ncbi:MAG: Ig-like domain-containing protein [Lachnospiraceae bacterium]|nr:Ig-like domain-containing protein [Lachnospiraceae bacterium]
MKKNIFRTLLICFAAVLFMLPRKAYAGEDLGVLSAKNPSLHSIFTIKKGEEHILFFEVKGSATVCRLHLENLGGGDSVVSAFLEDSNGEEIDSMELDEPGYIGGTTGNFSLFEGRQYIVTVKDVGFTGMDSIKVGIDVFCEDNGGAQFDYEPLWKEIWGGGCSDEETSKAAMVISNDTLVLKKGKTAKLKVTLPDELKGTKVTWKSSDKKVAKVSKKGKVTAKGEGTAIITCTSKKDKSVSVQCEVTVYKKNPPAENKETDAGKDSGSGTVEASGELSSVRISSSNPILVYLYNSGFVYGAQRNLTLKTNDYEGELTLEFDCSDGTDTRTVEVKKNKTYNITYTYGVSKNADTVIKQPDQQIMIGTDPITGLPKYTTIPGQTTTIPASDVSIPLNVRIKGGASDTFTASFPGKIKKGSFSIAE